MVRPDMQWTSAQVNPALAALLTALWGCQAAPEPSAAESAMERAADAPSARAVAPGLASASEAAPPAGSLERTLFDASQRLAAGWERGPLRFEGELAAGEKQSYMALLRYGRCYRIFGAGGGDIEDLDLSLFDPSELPVQRDLGQDPLPVIGLQAHLCPQVTATYRLEVKAYRGAGRFIVQAMESPH